MSPPMVRFRAVVPPPMIDPLPVEATVKFPPIVVDADKKIAPVTVWLGLFHSTLPPMFAGNVAIVVVMPVTLSRDPAFHVAVGMVPPFWAWV